MREKLSLERFNILKTRYLEEYQKLQQEAEKHITDEKFNEEQFLREATGDLLAVQNEILSYDLSEIPFEAWDSIILMRFDGTILDLSETHANIDFKVISEFFCEEGINFKGCKIKNLERARYLAIKEYFDPEVITENADLFLSDSFDHDFEIKFAGRVLEIDDLLTLSQEQLEEIDRKKSNSYLSYSHDINREFMNVNNYFSLSKTIEIYKRNPEYINELSQVVSLVGAYTSLSEEEQEQVRNILNIEDIDSMMEHVDEYFYQFFISMSANYNMNISDRFKKKHPDMFPDEKDLPPDVLERFDKFRLTIEDYINNLHFFGKTDLTNHLGSYTFREVNKILGPGVLFEIITTCPELFRKETRPFDIEDDYNFSWGLQNRIDDLIKRGVEFNLKDVFFQLVFDLYFKKNDFKFSKAQSPEIYANLPYPEWIKATGYYVSEVGTLTNTSNLDLITSETYFSNENVRKLLADLGINNIIRFEREIGSIDPRHLEYFIAFYKNKEIDEQVTTYQQFLDKLANMIHQLIISHTYKNTYHIMDTLPEEFKSRYPKIFLSNDAPTDLKYRLYTNNLTFGVLKEHPEWQEFLKDIDLIDYFNINLPKIGRNNERVYQSKTSLFDYLKSKNQEKLIYQYILMYGELLNNIVIPIDNLGEFSLEGFDSLLQEVIYRKIISDLLNSNISYAKVYDDNLPQEFKNKYPELFLSSEAPEELREKFYNRKLELLMLKDHPEWIQYLEHTNLLQFQNIPKTISVYSSAITTPQPMFEITYYELYLKKYGLRAFLDLIMPYNEIINFFRYISIDVNDDSKESLDNQIISKLYTAIIKNTSIPYSDNVPEEFKQSHPDIFLPNNSPQGLKEKFYGRNLKFEDIRLHPEYLSYLKDIPFHHALNSETFRNSTLLNLSSEDAYNLVSIFGEYIGKHQLMKDRVSKINVVTEDDIRDLKNILIEAIKNGTITYKGNAPDFIKSALPNMFLDENAPEDLKNFYYELSDTSRINFSVLKAHPEWLPFLTNKTIMPFFFNHASSSRPTISEISEFISTIGGEAVFLKLGLQKPKDIDTMFSRNKLDLLAKWYLKTGKKFVPDSTVMLTIPFEDADKFLANGKSWSTLMRMSNFKKSPEGIDALIKLAYTFGIFDGDPQAEKRLLSLISDLPRKLAQSDKDIIVTMENMIIASFVEPEQMKDKMLIGLDAYNKLRAAMLKEGFNIEENKPILPLIYNFNDASNIRLLINEQQYPETSKWARTFMEENNVKGMVSPIRAHQLFGGFLLKCDVDFREFLLKNIDEILNNPDYGTYIASIQKQFQEIKAINSNRVLTLDLAVNYVKQNRYQDIQIGNESLAYISSVAGYSQEDFNTLQKIFNYGKMRTFSSVPRISSSKDSYSYEIIRLSDAFAIAAGTLSDCCQELHNCAELDMEHSMTSKHGRLFLVKDELGNIVAQSWTWRNQNVLCFDNIEIPDKAFTRATREKNLTKEEFAKQIYDLYVQAAKELIELDKETYDELLASGRINQDQYDSLRLTKVTVGLGYNDIAAAIRKYSKENPEYPKLPPNYEAPVPLDRPLYVSDSRTQYILSEDEGHRETEYTETLPIYNDDYEEYNKNTISEREILTLQKLEILSGRTGYNLKTDIEDTENIGAELASRYMIEEDNLRLMITPNFAIIYEETNTDINILDLFTNTRVEFNGEEKDVTNEVNIQVKLALLQLAKKKKNINTSKLEQDINAGYEEINALSDNFDEERGISRGAI